MKSSAPPPAPDPAATAVAQAAANKGAAITQQQVNMVDQTTPQGSLTYTQTGKWEDGTPKFAANVTLSPEEQRNQQQQWEFDNLTNTLGINQTKKLTGMLDTPFKLGNEATEARIDELSRARLDPQIARQRDALDNRLRNQGLRPGMEAYDYEMKMLGQQENDQRNQLLLQGRQMANQELLTERNQPLNETTALMAGGQVTQPNFQNTPTAQVAAPDVAGMTYQSYQMGPYAQWQQKNADRQAALGGIFGLGSAAMGGWARNWKPS